MLFGLDAFAGGFVVSTFMVFWFGRRFGASAELMGLVLFGSGLLQAVSSIASGRLATRFGLLPTMVFTHLPSNVLLILIPVMPTLGAAIAMLLLRSTLSQMDVPARQAYVTALVDPEERTAAAAFTNTARYVVRPFGAASAGVLMQAVAVGAPFVVAGVLKSVYDVLLFARFRRVPLPEERASGGGSRAESAGAQLAGGSLLELDRGDDRRERDDGRALLDAHRPHALARPADAADVGRPATLITIPADEITNMSWSFDPMNAPASRPVFFVSWWPITPLPPRPFTRVVLERRALAVALLGDADHLLALGRERRARSPRRPAPGASRSRRRSARPIGRASDSLNRIAWPLRETRNTSSLPSVSRTSISSSPALQVDRGQARARRVVLGQRRLLDHALARGEQQVPALLVLLEVDARRWIRSSAADRDARQVRRVEPARGPRDLGHLVDLHAVDLALRR